MISIILPARNEAENLDKLIPGIISLNPDAEIIVVNDGSTDETKQIIDKYGVSFVTHPYSMGNGAAIKSGVRIASGDILVFMDADGQHTPEDISLLLEKLDGNYKMVVGARSFKNHASLPRLFGNYIFNKLASVMTGYTILDLTSGFRAAEAKHFKRFLYLLPNGFSYPTTITMAFFRSGLPIAYVPISANSRAGKSHLNIFKEGVRFIVIILKIGALFSPMRLFLPISVALFITGLSYYAYTYISYDRFTNMSALLFISSLLTFLMGVLSELVSSLHYKGLD